MRIISKGKDYYDSALIHGRDETLVFLREETEGPKEIIESIKQSLKDVGISRRYESGHDFGEKVPYSRNKAYQYIPDSVDSNAHEVSIRVILVGFCGALYPAVMYNAQQYSSFDDTNVTEIVYVPTGDSLDDIVSISEKLTAVMMKFTPKFTANYLERSKRYDNRRKNLTYVEQIVYLAASMNSIAKKHEKIFIDNKIPYFVIDLYEGTTTFLPTLKNYQFYKAKDPFTAMQELSMYVGGVIPRQTPEMVTISDKDRIAQHGFDKLSFRHPFK